MFLHRLLNIIIHEHFTTSKLQVELLSTPLSSKTTLTRTCAPPRGHAWFRYSGNSQRWASAVTVSHHAASGNATWPTWTTVTTPCIPPVFSTSTTSFPLTHRPRLFLLHVQTYLTTEHDRLITNEMEMGQKIFSIHENLYT